MEFITEVLGLAVKRQKWEDQRLLPYYLSDQYEFCLATIGDCKCLIVSPKIALGTITTIRKQINRIQNVSGCPVVIELPYISRQRRQSLIEDKISFIVPAKQLYLPFLGIYLNERFTNAPELGETFLPSTQLLLFYIIYLKSRQLSASKAASIFNVSPMTITRAVKQLTQLNLIHVFKAGTNNIIETNFSPKELYEQAKPYLIQPIRKKVYIDNPVNLEKIYCSGITALASKTFLNSPIVKIYATLSRHSEKFSTTVTLFDTTKQVELELWKYDPGLLAQDHSVDSLSLITSLKDNKEARVEQATEELLEQLWEDING